MAKLDVLDVVGNGVETLRLRHYLLARHEYELGFLINKFLDEPWACDAVDLDLFAGDPFHAVPPVQFLCRRTSGVREDEDSTMRGRNDVKLVRRHQRRRMRARASHGSRGIAVAWVN